MNDELKIKLVQHTENEQTKRIHLIYLWPTLASNCIFQ